MLVLTNIDFSLTTMSSDVNDVVDLVLKVSARVAYSVSTQIFV